MSRSILGVITHLTFRLATSCLHEQVLVTLQSLGSLMGDHDQQAPIISTASLPDVSQSDANFYDTSFFNGKEGNEPPQLPSPTEVLLKSQETSSGVVIFEDLDLAVKFGPPECVELSEAQAMIAIRRAFPLGNIPVPEVFGWKQREGQNFIYMSLVRGSTLREAWPLLDAADKTAIRDDLRRITTLLRSATHDKFPEIMIGTLALWRLSNTVSP